MSLACCKVFDCLDIAFESQSLNPFFTIMADIRNLPKILSLAHIRNMNLYSR